MLKRTYGRLLLALLVVTGFAGKSNDTSLTKAERKVLVSEMKETRTGLLNSLKGLSAAQLDFKPATDRWSIKECVYHIVHTEKTLFEMMQQTLKQPANPEKRSEIKISDEDLMKGIRNRDTKVKTSETFEPAQTGFSSLDEALDAFKEIRGRHLKYARTTTEDLRNHVMDTPLGKMDAYQFLLFMVGHCQRHTLQIQEVMADAKFPVK